MNRAIEHTDSWMEYSGRDHASLLKLQQASIEAGYCSIKPPIRAFYFHRPGEQPIIQLAHTLRANPVLKRSTVWEMIAYHYTSSTAERYTSFMRYSTGNGEGIGFGGGGANRETERRALMWASRHLISNHEISWYTDTGGGTLEHFAQRHGVTLQMAFARLAALEEDQPNLAQQLQYLMLRWESGFGKPKRYRVLE